MVRENRVAVCQIASLKSDVWKHFIFSESRHEKGEKVAGRPQTICRDCQIVTNKHLHTHLIPS